jgi:signal transduction histidine kinase
MRIHDKKGRVRWLETNSVLIDWEGQPGALTFFDDVTERQHLEGQLLQSEKMASVGQLAAGVAHEINNPAGFISSNLNTLSEYVPEIIGFAEAYRREAASLTEASGNGGSAVFLKEALARLKAVEADEDMDFILNDLSELVSECREGIERIRRIVADLKNFAHPGDEKVTHADLNENLASTLNIVWNELKYKAEVVTDYGDLPLVPCIPQQLNQVFMNLLVNAAQAIEGKGEIRIGTACKGNWVEVRISDTGTGIAPENLSRIFDPFFTTKEVGKGTGLGLNLSYNIVKKHGGDLGVESALGKGTTFCVRIPVPEDLPEDSDEPGN